MRIASFVMAAALSVAATAAYADTTTSRIVEWDPAKKQLTLADKTRIEVDPSKMPTEAKIGSTVTIIYEANESGVENVESVVVRN